MTIPVPWQRLASTVIGGLAGLALLVDGLQGGWGLGWFGYGLVGAFILWHRPGNAIGWLCVGIAGAEFPATHQPAPDNLADVSGAALLLAQMAGPLGFLMLIALVALFPSGRPDGRISRFVIWCVTALCVLVPLAVVVNPAPVADSGGWVSPLAIDAVGVAPEVLLDQGFLLVPLLLAVSVVSLVRRWRRSQGDERLRYRWFGVSAAVSVVVFIIVLTGFEGVAVAAPLLLANNALPIALAVAVTRYGLYELDRVISRTASYAIVTGLLLATYALVVTSASRLLGETSTLAVALATLAAAALFRPLLSRVQRVVDRRFNRQRVDHEKAIDEFAARLRDQLDEADARADLVRVAVRTLEPASARLWLRGSSR